MNIKPIKSENDYKEALARVAMLMDAVEHVNDEDALDELDVLSTLIEKYESEQFPSELPDVVEAIKFRMEQGGHTQKDLADVLGSRSRASEVLSRRRGLTLEMIRRLNSEWAVPLDVLVQDTEKVGRPVVKRAAKAKLKGGRRASA